MGININKNILNTYHDLNERLYYVYHKLDDIYKDNNQLMDDKKIIYYENEKNNILEKLDDIEKFIYAIDDPLLKTIAEMKFLDGETVENIAFILEKSESTIKRKINIIYNLTKK